MRRHRIKSRTKLRTRSRRKDERGIIITLVAVFMLAVVGAMAALSIDVVTMYTARSEAQLAADGSALAAARVLANSGATSDTTGTLLASAETPTGPAKTVAIQVAEQNQVGGTYLTGANVTAVTFGGTATNPTVTIRVQVTNLPTFFARIWGTKFLTVAASATAEAYNPSAPITLSTRGRTPVAPICVKPWLLPNMDPSPGGTTIFDPTTGAITNPGLLGYTSTTGATRLRPQCTSCTGVPLPTPNPWRYYPGDPTTTFPPPTQALPTCTPALTTGYEESIAGCVQTAIACNGTANIDTTAFPGNRNTQTTDAVNCLTHATTGGGDTVPSANPPTPPTTPLEFVGGVDNPIAGLSGKEVVVSDSLVTVPVFNSTPGTPPASTVTIIGFVQLFLNPDGFVTPPPVGHVNTTIINMAGCGTSAVGNPILGNGASPVAVRLISAP